MYNGLPGYDLVDGKLVVNEAEAECVKNRIDKFLRSGNTERYKTATILFRDGEDDFTLWVVDLPVDRVMKFERSECAIVGEIDSLLMQLPIEPGNPHNRIHLLRKECERYILYTSLISWDFFERYIGEGVSSRGNKEATISEVEELFQPQIIAPHLEM